MGKGHSIPSATRRLTYTFKDRAEKRIRPLFSFQMITIEKCNEILKNNQYKLKGEEVKELREYLYFLANLNNSIINENK
jgi:hypothetical protein